MLMKPKIVEIASIKRQNDQEYLLRIEEPMKHDPGQFLEVSVLGIGEAPISICSYNPEYVELSVRNVGNVTNALCSMKKGDRIGIRGPYGKGYPMSYFHGDNVMLIGGGCGVAPLRGIMEYIEANRDDFHDVHLFYGFGSPKEILFHDDIKRYVKNFNFKMTLDKGPKSAVKICSVDVGLVTAALEKSGISTHNCIVFVCGPSIMMKFTVFTLQKMGFHDDQIYLSFERHMKCGVQKCGHCMINGIYVCKDGPVFRFDQVKDLTEKW